LAINYKHLKNLNELVKVAVEIILAGTMKFWRCFCLGET